MCGIAGKINLHKDKLIDQRELGLMTDTIYHRGPDDEGFYIDRNVGLGFRRLSIIDLSTGHQPLSNENDTKWIVFNGEIYNYEEQRQILINKGYKFKTKTDTEVILKLYEEYGVECLQYLRGMFGFAIWDGEKQQLFCARDRFGIKPFFYYKDDNKLVFASEIKSILKCDGINKKLSAEAVDSYFAFSYITSDLSIYENIKKLPAAHYLLLSFKNEIKFEIKQYWTVKFEPDYSKSEAQWIEELDATLSDTVKLHMIADVPLGAFLSGGIDSSSVVAMMAKNSSKPIKTFSIGFKEEKFNELHFAREIANKYNCEHHEQIVEPESMSLLPKLVAAYDEPFGDPSAIPTYYVCKMAREFVTVALSGDGGDELFAGYTNHSKFNQLHNFPLNFNSPKMNKFLWGNIYKATPQGMKGKGTLNFLAQNKKYIGAYLTTWSVDEREKLLSYNSLSKSKLFLEGYKEQILEDGKQNDFITNLQNLDIQTYMVDDILTKVDRASMLSSLEVRVPLLDHKFAELTFKIPSGLKLKKKEGKYIFKQAMKKYLPENIYNHPKQGFGVPLSIWFNDDLKDYVNDTLLSNNTLLSNYININYVKKIVRRNRTGMRDFSSKIWSLIIFDEWLKQSQV